MHVHTHTQENKHTVSGLEVFLIFTVAQLIPSLNFIIHATVAIKTLELLFSLP